MEMRIDEGWINTARKVVSPNCDARPGDGALGLIVIHGISLPPEQYGGPYIDQLFCNALDPQAHPYFESIAGLEVSSHLLIRRDGELVQYVPFDKRAWHAGRSCYEGRERCNDFSIGIELEGCDHQPYEDAQYACLAAVVTCLCAFYPGLDTGRIVGHSDIAPGRKTDPGPAFDWPRFRSMLMTSQQ